MKKDISSIFTASTREFFSQQVEEACQSRRVQTLPAVQGYLVGLLEYYMISQNLFDREETTGKMKIETLAEMFLKANNIEETAARAELLKKLGDTSLYISGFFGDSLKRKVVDIDYYVGMGGVAYGTLATIAKDEQAQVFSEFSKRFIEFVDVLTYISQRALVQTNQDLLRLYDRYVATGSELAREQLLEKGIIAPQQSTSTKNNKQ